MTKLTTKVERRIRKIVRERNEKSYSFKFAARLHDKELDPVADFYIIGNRRTPFSLWRTLDDKGRSIKAVSMLIYTAPEGATNKQIAADICEAIEARI